MRILIVHNYHRQLNGEHFAVDAHIRLLRARGHAVTMYAKHSGIVQGYGVLQKALFFPQAVFSWPVYQEVRRLIRRERPAVAHVHNVFPLISPSVYHALRAEHVPIVQTMHNYRLMCPNGLFFTHGHICERCKHGNTWHAVRLRCLHGSRSLSALYALVIGLHRRLGTFDLIDRLLALTTFGAEKIQESGMGLAEKTVVLGNFLPDPLPVPGDYTMREPYVVYLGRLSPEKGVETVLEALEELPDLQLKVLGDGPQAADLRTRVAQQDQARVTFLGYVAGEQKYEVLRRSCATIVPTRSYETFGLAALESMAVGTPVVTTDLGGQARLVEDDRYGLLFRAGDSQDLRAKLRRLITEPALIRTYGEAGRRAVEDHWSANAHYKQLMRIYEDVIRRVTPT